MADVAKKLLVKPGSRVLVLTQPKSLALGLPSTASVATSGKGPFDVVLAFVIDGKSLNAVAAKARDASGDDGVLWFAYPKGSSGIATDLSRDATWRAVQALGIHPCAAASIDDTWSAIRFRRAEHTTKRTASGRPERTAKATLPTKPPKDLAAALAKSAQAKATWATLAPSHVKEYLRWILEAKQAETRARRIAKAIEMLAAGTRDRNKR